MDSREGRCIFGFLLFGLAPILATAGGVGVGMIIFAAGLLVAASACA